MPTRAGCSPSPLSFPPSSDRPFDQSKHGNEGSNKQNGGAADSRSIISGIGPKMRLGSCICERSRNTFRSGRQVLERVGPADQFFASLR